MTNGVRSLFGPLVGSVVDGFTIAIVIMAGLREQLDLATVPGIVRGTALSLMLAGILSLTFTGFAGLGG